MALASTFSRRKRLFSSRISILLFGVLATSSTDGTVHAWMPSYSLVSNLKSVAPLNTNGYRARMANSGSRSNACNLAASSVDVNEKSAVAEFTKATLEQQAEGSEATSDSGLELDVTQKVINGVFLAAAFGYALYTILNIDHGMTRGWSASEIAMRIPVDNWGNYEESLANKPVFTKTLINVIIYLLGDWLSQTVFRGNNALDFDISRTLKNGFIGLCFGPLVHEYYQWSDSILPPEDGMFVRLQKILMDQSLYLSIKCSIYIAAVGMLNGDDWPTAKQNVQDKIGGVVFTAWKFWPLVHCITYGLIPARHRILWVNSVDLIWNAILATQAQKDAPISEEAKEESVVAVAMPAVTEGESSVLLEQEEISSEKVSEEGSPVLVVLENQKIEDAIAEILPSPSEAVDGAGQNMTSSAAAVPV